MLSVDVLDELRELWVLRVLVLLLLSVLSVLVLDDERVLSDEGDELLESAWPHSTISMLST